MSLVRYQPVNVFDQFNKEFANFFPGFVRQADNDNAGTNNSRWAPAVDIKEQESQFVLLADIPGVDPKDIEITVDHGVLTIKGERSYENSEEKDGYKRVERASGTFYRRFNLPDSVNADLIEAKGEHGVLTISIPKQQQAQPKRISIAA